MAEQPSRAELRRRLLARRHALGEARRTAASAAICNRLAPLLARLPGPIAFYVPIRDEPDLLPLAFTLHERGMPLALPVVVAKDAPLSFWRWRPGEPLVPGAWNIPVPPRKTPLCPRLILVPVVGFDRAGFRIGYGGGYYDRTLAALHPRPWAVGVGFAACAVDTIHPRPHDQRLDLVVTEEGIVRFRADPPPWEEDDGCGGGDQTGRARDRPRDAPR